jgi:hypothetical protein
MPRLSAFYGLVIFMPASDHDPPHFHVRYAEHRGRFVIGDGDILPGSTLPPRAVRLAEKWRRLHVEELLDAWNSIRRGDQPGTIDPLP